jgi:hypothetical protein
MIPTRIDVAPMKFGPFSTFAIPHGAFWLDIVKFLLVLYTVTIVRDNLKAKKYRCCNA